MSKNKRKASRKQHVNRNYKDSLFRMVFGSKKAALELYNAINHSHYDNADDLEFTTIEGAIYMGVKNDLSFLVDSVMNLYEAQSTTNPNMPLRGLIYFSKVYQGFVEKQNLNVYSSIRLKLPVPRYIVFYNGTKEEPDRLEYRLSESFEKKQDSYCLECVAAVLNINAGHNRELMENCSLLWQYASFVAKVRYYLDKFPNNLEYAVDFAVKDCIEDGILVDFLRKNRGEVKDVILTEYNRELHIKSEKKLSYEEGLEKGKEQGLALGKEQGLELGIKVFITFLSSKEGSDDKPTIIEALQEHFTIDKEKAEFYYEKFSKNK